MKLKTIKPYCYFRYDLEQYNDTACLRYPLYGASPDENEPRAAYIVIDMAWYDSYFVAGRADTTELQETDLNNRILQFEISPLITNRDLKGLSEDAIFFALVRRIYVGCVYERDFKACYYNKDAQKAITAVKYHLKKIPVARLPENPVEFYQELVGELREKYQAGSNLFQKKRKCNSEDFMSIIPENSHLVDAENLLCPHRGLYLWPVGDW